MKILIRFIFLLLLFAYNPFDLQTHAKDRLIIKADQNVSPIPNTLYGVFFEDLNFGADGGLYAEKIKNRSFDFPQNFMGWKIFGNVELKKDGPFPNNPHYVTLKQSGHREKKTGLVNEGFFGIGFEDDKSYRFSVWARTLSETTSSIIVELIDPSTQDESQVMASGYIEVTDSAWKKYEVILNPHKTVKNGQLRVFLSSDNPVDLEHLSLFPVNTWAGQENGLRIDLVEMLRDLNPGVFRFPGGCIVEGTDTASRYRWKNTIGPVENRKLNENRWQFTFSNRSFPDYYQSNGLGFFEFFQLAEDLGAEPLPILNAGLICQFQNEDENQPSMEELQEYIDDALDLIEFANGDINSTWGRVRSDMGHSKPFNLKFIGIGNEQWGPQYPVRLKAFKDAIHGKYPEIKIIGSVGPYPEGIDFEYLWKELKDMGIDMVDEHMYQSETWFSQQTDRYDSYDREGPEIFVGEYACHIEGEKYNQFQAALMEAAFMTGLERNADIVKMATYAPLLSHIDGWQWRPDLIWFDNLESFPTSSYWVQKLFADNRGDFIVPFELSIEPSNNDRKLFISCSFSGDECYIVKIVNTDDSPEEVEIIFEDLLPGFYIEGIDHIVLKSADLTQDNSISNPTLIRPISQTFNYKNNDIVKIEPYSVNILKFKKRH